MSRLCTICARGGSKGVKNKNIRFLLDKPLIAYSIHQAKQSNLFDYISISSDSEEILEVAHKYGADILINRPSELAEDTSAKTPAIRHCVSETERLTGRTFPIIVDLDATSPLRTVQDLHDAMEYFEREDASNLITGMPSRRSPYFNLVELNENGSVQLSKQLDVPIVRRQDSPRCFDMNASIYIWKREVLFNYDTLFLPDTILYEMPEERSIDIDNEIDFKLVEIIMSSRDEVEA